MQQAVGVVKEGEWYRTRCGDYVEITQVSPPPGESAFCVTGRVTAPYECAPAQGEVDWRPVVHYTMGGRVDPYQPRRHDLVRRVAEELDMARSYHCAGCGARAGEAHKEGCRWLADWAERHDKRDCPPLDERPLSGAADAPARPALDDLVQRHGRRALLEEAIKLTTGDRDRDYGEPVANMQHIANIFNAITGHSLTAREIALVHQATKLARRARNFAHRDSYVDAMAYAGIEYECALTEADGA